MDIPSPNHPGWAAVIKGEKSPSFEYLATKILLGRLNLAYRKDPNPKALQDGIAVLREFLRKNSTVPKVQADIRAITG
jgi:hypothetical protein